MRRALLALLVVGLVAAPVLAGQNPDIRAYIDFDPPTYTHSTYPAGYTQAVGYLMLDTFGALTTGMTAMSFAINITPGMSLVTSYASLLPGGLAIGNWETGITLSATSCVNPDGSTGAPNIGVVAVATITVFYSGTTTGDILIVDHPDFPRWVVDCGQPVPATDFYCVLSHGGVGQEPSVPGDCEIVPVEDSSWGSIKSLYR